MSTDPLGAEVRSPPGGYGTLLAKRLRSRIPHNELPAAAHSAPGIPPLGREDYEPSNAMKQNNSEKSTVTAGGRQAGLA